MDCESCGRPIPDTYRTGETPQAGDIIWDSKGDHTARFESRTVASADGSGGVELEGTKGHIHASKWDLKYRPGTPTDTRVKVSAEQLTKISAAVGGKSDDVKAALLSAGILCA